MMARQKWAVGGSVLLGLLALPVAGRGGEAKNVKVIEKLGGRVTMDDKVAGSPIVGVDLSRTKVTDAELKTLKEIKSLRELKLSSTAVTNTGLNEVKELKTLQDLDLYETKVTDAG